MATSDVQRSLYAEPVDDVTLNAFKGLISGFRTVLERQLADFLPDGKYGADPSPELQEQMKHCKLTNLLGKYVFGDVEKLLKGKSERRQLDLLKCQLRYLKEVLEIKTNQKFKGATTEILKARLIKIVSSNQENIQQPTAHDNNEDEEISDSDPADSDSPHTMDTADGGMDVDGEPFSFTNQGLSVAVAYDEGVYIGQVVNTKSEEEGKIQFLSHLSGDRFRWPNIDQVELVDKKYIVDCC